MKQGAVCMKECLLKGDFDGVAACLRDGWNAKKGLASSISTPHIDEMYDYIMRHGGRAAKISGAGGGGFMMILCDPKRRFELVRELKKTDGTVMLASFTEKGSQAWRLY
jgi:D-glycero-alpha-D-manno-heptose-7-phosphate kinase